MVEAKELKGHWWLPENPEHQVGGILTFSPTSGISLELFSALDDNHEKTQNNEPVGFQTVLGKTTQNKKITVESTIRTNYTTHDVLGSKEMTSEHTAMKAYIGEHFDSDPLFDEIVIDFPPLHGWFGKTGIESDVENIEGEGEPIMVYRHHHPECVSVELEDADLMLISTRQSSGGFGESIHIEDANFHVKKSDGGLSLQESREWARRLQAFLTLACGEEVHFETLDGRMNTENQTSPYLEVEALFPRSRYKETSSTFDINKHTFGYSDIEDRFESVIQDWFKKYDELEPVFSLYFSTQYNSGLYVQNEFLSLTRAVESYHRIQHGGTYLSPEEFDDYYEKLVEGIPEKYDESFTSHLENGTFKYANEYSLQKRLDILSEQFDAEFSVLPSDLSGITRSIVDARNRLTHRDPESENPEPRNLIHYSNILRVLI